MTRKSLSVVMAVLMIVINCPFFVVVAATTPQTIGEVAVLNRIEELTNLFSEKAYFTTNRTKCTTSSPNSNTVNGYHDSCDDCKTANIIKTDWFKSMFNIKSGEALSLPFGTENWSCHGFLNVAYWYIFKTNNTDYISRTQINSSRLVFSDLIKVARPGDYVRVWKDGKSSHSLIYISGDTKGIRILDSNGSGCDKDNGCKVQNHYVTTYTNNSSYTFNVVRADNYSDKPFSGVYRIQTALDSNKFLDISGQNKEDGDNVHIWDRYDVPSQQFVIKPNGDYYSIINVNSGKALCIKGDSKNSGANVHQWSVHSGDSQKWQFEDAGDGYYYIKSALGNYLDVSNAETKNGTNVQVYKGNQTKAQKWKLIPIDSSVGTPSVSYSNISNGNYYISNDGYEMSVLADKAQRNSINAVSGIGTQFSITKDGDYYLVKPVSSSGNYVLNAWWSNNRSTENGDEVSLYKNTHDGSQRWYFEACNGGYLIHPGDATHLSITRDTNTNKLYVKTTTKQANQIWKLNTQPKETKKYYLDLNGFLGGTVAYDIKNWGTCDIYINGERVANDVNDFYTAYPLGTQYEIKDIQPVSGKEYKGVRDGKIRGTIEDSDVNVVLEFVTKTSDSHTITYNANGGSGAPASQSFNGSTATISKTVPTKSGYVFTGWATSADGNVRFVPGQPYKGGSITLYAKWSRRVTVQGTGNVVNYYKYTDIVAKVDGASLRSYNIDGNTAIIAEDLAKYGFSVFWNANDRTLLIGEGNGRVTGNYSSSSSSGKVGTVAGDVYATDIVTFINGQAALSYNIGGMTAILIDDLSTFGSVKWNPSARVISFNR